MFDVWCNGLPNREKSCKDEALFLVKKVSKGLSHADEVVVRADLDGSKNGAGVGSVRGPRDDETEMDLRGSGGLQGGQTTLVPSLSSQLPRTSFKAASA